MSAASARSPRTRRAVRVEVRDVGRARQLRIDGTLASLYEPGRPASGSVWDALAAPLLLLPPARRRRILVLGLGGGSAARVVRALAPRARIVGVEIDPEVLRMARRWFDLDALGVETVTDDAREFLEAGRSRFDAILDDVFVGSGRRVRKPGWLPRPGLARVARRLARGGLAVSNAIGEADEVARAMRETFPRALEIELDDYHNRILAGGPPGVSGRALRAAVARDPVLRSAVSKLHFRTLR